MSKTLNDYLQILGRAEALPSLSWAPQDELLQADLAEQVFMNLAQGYFVHFQATGEHPDFGPMYNSVLRLQPNPDDTYFRTPLDERGVYRLSGERGGSRLLTLTLAGVIIGESEQPQGQTAEYDLDDHLHFGADGSFDVLLSESRPQSYEGDWLRLPPGTHCGHIRQRCYDWGNEKDARFAIERLDVSPLKPRPDRAILEDRLTRLAEYAERHSRQWLRYQDQMRAADLVNRIVHHGFSDLGGIKVQVYWWGIFELAADEALILETEVPEHAPYWNVQLNDQIWNTLEYVWRQSSLNGHQARLDSDGKFRAVISVEDPGVPNWLDTVGRSQGSVVGRWYKCASNPVPSLKKVKLAELREHLPADTPQVSREEREAGIRARARGAQLRRRW